MNIAGDHRRHNERRVNLGGLLGGLTRPTIKARLADATLLGSLYLLQNSLILLPNRQINAARFEYTLLNRFFSWDLNAAIRVANLGNLSADQIRQQSDSVGDALFASALIYLFIWPVNNRKTFRTFAED